MLASSTNSIPMFLYPIPTLCPFSYPLGIYSHDSCHLTAPSQTLTFKALSHSSETPPSHSPARIHFPFHSPVTTEVMRVVKATLLLVICIHACINQGKVRNAVVTTIITSKH